MKWLLGLIALLGANATVPVKAGKQRPVVAKRQ